MLIEIDPQVNGPRDMPADSANLRLADRFGVVTTVHTPRRLSDATRALAARVIGGAYGRAMESAPFSIDAESMPDATPNARYAEAVSHIAETAPLRIVPEEKLIGAAPFIEAPRHMTPGSDIGSTSHTTIGLDRVLKTGYGQLRQRVEGRLVRADLDDAQADLLRSMLRCLDAAAHWHRRYVMELERLIAESAADRRRHYEEVLAAALNVPENPPASFREALQSLWFMWEFQRLCGNWSGLGRVDMMLGPHLERDLADGHITLDEARELIAHFWIKGCEWTGAKTGHVGGSGDAQFYQNVILAGVDQSGKSVINDVTYLILDAVEELHVSDFPIAVRVNANTPDCLWRRIAEIQRLGGGIVSIYNEDVVIPALVRFGYSIEDARTFTNDGCWEVLVPGKTAFSYRPFDMLLCLQHVLALTSTSPLPGGTTGGSIQNLQGDGTTPTLPHFDALKSPLPGGTTGGAIQNLQGDGTTPTLPDFEALYSAFLIRLREQLEAIWRESAQAFSNGAPAPLLSLFVDDCIERGRGYHHRGAHYMVRSPHAGGMPDVANSLFVLKKVVFDEKSFTLDEFVHILRSNWQDHELLRQRIRNEYKLYGNDSDEADAMLLRVYRDYVRLCEEVPTRNGVRMPPGISTFGRQIEYSKHRAATAFGAFAGDILAPNLAPTPGTERNGPTAVVKSFCKVDFARLACGTPLDMRLHPSCLRDEAGLEALVALLKTFVAGGGFYLQVDVIDADTLRDAQQHPERYTNLSVRVSGWSARFTTLAREWQDMIIARTELHLR